MSSHLIYPAHVQPSRRNSGTPRGVPSSGLGSRAYPRRRGGTNAFPQSSEDTEGLSPQARGNLSCEAEALRAQGPIPAGAGEPWMETPTDGAWWAYPRRRGGTGQLESVTDLELGLSPQARGNHRRVLPTMSRQGPIPAGAGEPAKLFQLRDTCGAYPRRRGGTFGNSEGASRKWGLSPQARGNRHRQRGRGG